MLPEETLTKIREVLAQYPVKRARLFGSQARGDARPGSDIDLLIEFLPRRRMGLFKLMGLKHRLEDTIGRTVDLSAGEPPKAFQQDIHPDLVTIYEAPGLAAGS